MGFGRILDVIFAIYFFTHIPITIFIDGQAVIPRKYFPSQCVELVDWYSETYKDPMMRDPPIWYRTFVSCELLFQFPFFFVAFYAFYGGYKNNLWIRVPGLVYAAHVSTTVAPILAHILFYDFSNGSYPGPETLSERAMLSSFYLPYLIIPLLMLIRLLFGNEHVLRGKQKVK